MKAEEREELKQNDMVEWFQVGLPLFLRQNGSYLLLALALGLLGYQLWGWHSKKKAAEIESAWNELMTASEPGVRDAPGKLQDIIAQYPVKTVQAMAWLQIANFYLDDVAEGNPPEGYNGVKIGKTDALAKAEDAAHHVLSEYPRKPSRSERLTSLSAPSHWIAKIGTPQKRNMNSWPTKTARSPQRHSPMKPSCNFPSSTIIAKPRASPPWSRLPPQANQL